MPGVMNINMSKPIINTKALIISALFVALISLGSFIKIPIPVVPVTLQMFLVLITGQVLKPKLALFTLTAYFLLGILGVPVFSGGGGPGYFLHPTMGYIIGFIFGSAIISLIVSKSNYPSVKMRFAANLMGVFVIYLFGISYFLVLNKIYFLNELTFSYVFIYFFAIFIPSDLMFCFLSAYISKRIKSSVKI